LATLLNDGRVLLIGWSNTGGGAEIYDPVAETFTPVANWPPDVGFVSNLAVLLPDGRVLLATADYPALFDPVAGAFTIFSAWCSMTPSRDIATGRQGIVYRRQHG